jgi:hypothetical protein
MGNLWRVWGVRAGVLLTTQQIPVLFWLWEKNREKKAKRLRSTHKSRTIWEKVLGSPAEKPTKDGILKQRNQLAILGMELTAGPACAIMEGW